MTQTPLLEVENLRTTFETDQGRLEAVNGVSFNVRPGEIHGIAGESGSGKSVTALSVMRLLGDEAEITADSMKFKGEELLNKTEKEMQRIRGGEIGMIFQDPMHSLNPVMTVGEQIAEVARHHGETDESSGLLSELKRKYVTGTSTKSQSWQKALDLLEDVDMPDPAQRAKEYPHQLSGGMIQRVMIAQVMAGDPSLIIADEPTTSLDVSIEAQVLRKLIELKDEFDISIILITHDLAVVKQMCDRVSIIYAGEMMEQAPTGTIFSNPKHPYTEALMESIPKITREKQDLKIIEGNVPNLTEKPTGCPFRDRCGKAFEKCDQPLEEHVVDTDHVVNCHLYDDEAAFAAADAVYSSEKVSSSGK